MADQINQQFGIDASQALAALKQLDTSYAALEARLNSVANTLQSTSRQLSGSVRNFANNTTTGMAAATQSINATNQSVNRLTTSMALMSRIVFTQFVVSSFRQIRAAAADAAIGFSEFEKKLADIRSIDPTANLDQLVSSSRKLSDAFGIDLLEVANSRLEIVSAGFQDASEQQQIFGAAAKLAKVGVASQTQAVDLLSTSLNAFGASAQQSNKFAAAFFSSVDKGKLSVADLSALASVAWLPRRRRSALSLRKFYRSLPHSQPREPTQRSRRRKSGQSFRASQSRQRKCNGSSKSLRNERTRAYPAPRVQRRT